VAFSGGWEVSVYCSRVCDPRSISHVALACDCASTRDGGRISEFAGLIVICFSTGPRCQLVRLACNSDRDQSCPRVRVSYPTILHKIRSQLT